MNSLLFRAVKEKASDIHIEPFEKEFVVRFRIDGVLYDIIRQPKSAHAAISSRIKVMGQLDIAEKRLPQDGRIKIKIAGKDIDIRLSTVPTQLRRAPRHAYSRADRAPCSQLEQLGFTPQSCAADREADLPQVRHHPGHRPHRQRQIHHPFRLPGQAQQPDRNIMTVEDPIEYQIRHQSGAGQRQDRADFRPRACAPFFVNLGGVAPDPDELVLVEVEEDAVTDDVARPACTGRTAWPCRPGTSRRC